RPLGSAHRLTAPYQAIRASDGYVNVGANNDKLFAALCRAIDRPDLAEDPCFARASARMANRPALIDAIEKTTTGDTRAHWLARLDRAGVPSGPINDYAEALADPHALARHMVVDLAHPGAGPIKALGIPVKLSDTPGAVDRPAPLLGQHTAEILTELGYTEAARRALAERGVVYRERRRSAVARGGGLTGPAVVRTLASPVPGPSDPERRPPCASTMTPIRRSLPSPVAPRTRATSASRRRTARASWPT